MPEFRVVVAPHAKSHECAITEAGFDICMHAKKHTNASIELGEIVREDAGVED